MPELFGAFLFGLGLGYLMGRYRWVFALLLILLGLAFIAGPSDAFVPGDWSRFFATFLGGLIGNHLGMKHQKEAGSHA